MARKSFDELGINEKKCATCGKIFFPTALHVYKRNYGRAGRTKYFCKYSCMTAWDRAHPHKRQVIKGEMQ